jgi:cation transport ATPase
MANQKFSVEEILKEYQSDEATKGKKESPSGKLETQKMLNHAAGRRNVPPSTEASAEAYSYASSRTRQRTPYSPYRSEMAANINQIKQNRYQRRTDVEESRTAAFQTLELMRPKVSFVRSPAIRPQTTPNPKSDHISDYDGAVLLEQPESEQKPEQPVYQPAIQEMQDSTRAKEKKQAQKSRKPKKRTEQSYQRESLTEPEPEWRKAKTETFPAITPTQTLQETLREAQEAVAKAEAEAAAAVAALKAEQQQPQKKQPISHAFETLLTSPAKQQEKQQKQQQEKKQPVAKRWFSGKKRVPQVNHTAPPSYPEPAEAYRQSVEPQPKPYTSPVQKVEEPKPYMPPVRKVEEPKPYTPPVQKVEEPKSYIPPVQKVEEPKPYTPPVKKVEEPKPYTPPVQKVEEPKPYTPPVQKAEEPKPYTPPVQKMEEPKPYTPPVQKVEEPKPYTPPVQKVEEPKPYTPPVQKVEEPKPYTPPVQKVEESKPYTPPVQKVEEPKPYTPPVQKVEESKPYTSPVQKAEEPKPYTPPVQEPVQEEVTVSTTSEPLESTPEQKPKKKKWWQWWKKETPSVPKSAQSEESYMPPVQEEPVQPETSHIPPVQEPAQIEESPIITEPVEPAPVQKPKKQKKARKKKENPSKQQFAQPEESYAPPMQEYPQPEEPYAPPVQEYTQPEEAYMPPVQEYMQPEEPYTPPVQEYTQPEEAYMPPVQEYMQPEESPVATESELVKSTPIQKPKKQKKVRQKKEKKPKKQKSIPVEESTPVPVTNNVPNSEPEFAAGYAPAEQPLETDWTTEESSHSEWWDDSESKIPGSSGFDQTEEPAPQPEENESYTARFKKVVVQESTYTEPEQPKKPRKPKKEKTPRVKVQKPVPPEPKSIPNQEAEIRVNINLLRNAVFFRTVSLAVLTVIGAFLAIGESSYTLLYPALSQLMTVRGYCFLHLILGLLILFITFPTVINGMRKLFHREADSDTIAAMPLIPCLLTVLATIFVPEPMQHNLVHIFLPVSSFILLMNSIGKLFIIRRATRNFALLTKNFEKYIVTCVQSETAAEELTRGVVQDYPILATIRKTKQMSDFLRHTYASDLADRFSKKLAPIVAGISLLLAAAITGIRIGVLETPAENIPFFCSVLTMLLTAGCSAGIPLTVNLPLDRASKRLCPHGCTLLGYQSVDDFYDVNSILVPAATLFPKQSITISGIKNFSGFQVEEALLDAASMVYAADSILQNAFAALVEEKDGGMLYQVEDCSYEDNLGICGWIRHRRVLLGNREMMMAHHVEGMPTKVRELEMTSGSQDVLYLSVSGVVAGMFVIDITADPMVKRQMQRLKEEQISVIVKSVDSCITLQRLTTLFGVPDSMLKILPSADNDLYEKETAPLQDVSASTIHDGSFFGTARLLLEARSIKRAATTGLLLQVIAVILGLSICIGYILVNGYDNITSQTLLFFQLVMTGLTLLTTRLK